MTQNSLRVMLRICGIVTLLMVLLALIAISWLILSAPKPRTADGWVLLPALPLPHGELATTVIEHPDDCVQPPCGSPRLLVVGGIAGMGEVLDTAFVLDASAQQWAEGPSLPAPRHHTAAVAFDGKAYVSGGAQELERPWQGQADFWKLAPSDDTWRTLPAMPEPRWGHRMVAHAGRIYVVGGQGPSADVLVYEPGGGWSRGAAMPTPRDHLSVVVAGGEIWAIGGRAPASLSRVDIYDPQTDRWREGPALPAPTSGAAEGVIDGRILILGGEEPALRGGGIIDRHWQLAYAAPGAQWRPLARPPLAVHGADGAVLDGQLVIAGGAARHGLLSLFGWTGVVQALDADAFGNGQPGQID